MHLMPPSSKSVAKRHPDALRKFKEKQKRKAQVLKAGGFAGLRKRELTGKQPYTKKQRT